MPVQQFRPVAPAVLPEWVRTRILLRRCSRILFAFEDGRGTSSAVARALALARAFGSELHALSVVPLAGSGAHAAIKATLAGERSEERLEGEEGIRAWFARTLGPEGEPDALLTRRGDFIEQVAVHARELDASLIVTPEPRGAADHVPALAHAAQVPVLVARERAGGDAIVAATDLEDSSYPVLNVATLLSRKLAVPLIALHNLSPVSVLNVMDYVLSEPRRTARTLVELERGRLHRAVRALPGPATPLMAEEVDPVEAILREASGGGVDLVAVGARSETWWGRWLRRSVPLRVLERAPCSVLVVPIRDTQAAAPGQEAAVWA